MTSDRFAEFGPLADGMRMLLRPAENGYVMLTISAPFAHMTTFFTAEEWELFVRSVDDCDRLVREGAGPR